MKRANEKEPYLKILTSNWVIFPLLLILGFGGGFISAGYSWSKSGYQFLPSEIIVQPPAPNATWCYPDISLTGAEEFKKELTNQMKKYGMLRYNKSIFETVIKTIKADSSNLYDLTVLSISPQHFRVISSSGTNGNTTLVTEEGYFELYPIPKKRHEKYDSLANARLLGNVIKNYHYNDATSASRRPLVVPGR